MSIIYLNWEYCSEVFYLVTIHLWSWLLILPTTTILGRKWLSQHARLTCMIMFTPNIMAYKSTNRDIMHMTIVLFTFSPNHLNSGYEWNPSRVQKLKCLLSSFIIIFEPHLPYHSLFHFKEINTFLISKYLCIFVYICIQTCFISVVHVKENKAHRWQQNFFQNFLKSSLKQNSL